MADTGRTRLGRGLSALLGELPAEAVRATSESGVRDVPVARCRPSPHQPRKRFDPEADAALTTSVRERGVLQPILVTPDEAGGYRIVAGERRWRAAVNAGLERVPAVVKELAPREMLEIALVENLQREDLNAIEEANGYRRLIDEFGLGHAQIAERVGKDRSTVANTLRLLELPDSVQEMVEAGRLSMGHARALLGVEGPAERTRLAREAETGGFSVRQLEARVRRLRTTKRGRTAGRPAGSSQARFMEQELQRALGTRVRILEGRKGAGRIQLSYASGDDFERLKALLLGTDR